MVFLTDTITEFLTVRVSVSAKTTTDAGQQLRIPVRMMAKLRIIAAVRRRSMMELIEEYAGKRVDAEYRRAVADQQKLTTHDLGGES